MSLKSYASRLDRLESVNKVPIPMGDISFEDLMSGLAFQRSRGWKLEDLISGACALDDQPLNQ